LYEKVTHRRKSCAQFFLTGKELWIKMLAEWTTTITLQ
jgi:hypothetical protein